MFNKLNFTHRMLKVIEATFLSVLVLLIATMVAMATEPYRIGVSLGLEGNYAEPAKMQKVASVTFNIRCVKLRLVNIS